MKKLMMLLCLLLVALVTFPAFAGDPCDMDDIWIDPYEGGDHECCSRMADQANEECGAPDAPQGVVVQCRCCVDDQKCCTWNEHFGVQICWSNSGVYDVREFANMCSSVGGALSTVRECENVGWGYGNGPYS